MTMVTDLDKMSPNRWHLLHTQQEGDAVTFRRQHHGGGCFDSTRGRLVLYGCDTHGIDWLNSPLIFDPETLTWTRCYEDDDVSTYRINGEGLPVAGTGGDHPWTTHTFGAVTYDPERDEMVVSCHPEHMVPGRFTDALEHLKWESIRYHPTWAFRMDEGKWYPLPTEPVSFFPYATAWDSDRKAVVGYKAQGVWELAGETRRWKQTLDQGVLGYHNNAVYDSSQKAVVVFGENTNSNDVVVYDTQTQQQRVMPTPGDRPPEDQHCPMAFDPQTGKTVCVIDRVVEKATGPGERNRTASETWLYDLGDDAWTQVETAELPEGCGMNYNLDYDSVHGLCLLVTGNQGVLPSVWGMRVA